MNKNSRLKLAREKSGFSQQELADKMPVNNKGNRVTQSYIAQIEKDKGYSLKQAKEFAKILNTSANWLYFGNNDVTESNTTSIGNLDRLSDARMVNQRDGSKSPYPQKPPHELIQIIQNMQSLNTIQGQQIESLRKQVEKILMNI